MCDFVGFANLNRDISKDIHIVKDMNLKLKKRGSYEEGYFTDENINLGHRKLIIIDVENAKQPMSVRYNNTTYTIVYNGQLYNRDEVKRELQDLGYEFTRLFRYRNIAKSIYSLWD